MIQDDEVTHESEVEEEEDAVVVEDTETEEETLEARLAKAEADANKYRRLYEKKAKPKEEAPEVSKEQATPLNVEEAVLLANGMDERLLEKLKKVAIVNGTSLIKAKNDPLFVAVQEQFEKEQKKEQAQMPASRGAGAKKTVKTFNTPGLTREEHRALVQSQF